MELEKVVGGAHQRPLCLHRLEPPTEELAEASCPLDLADDRLHCLLAQLVEGLPLGAEETLAHPVAVGPAVGGASRGRVSIRRFIPAVATQSDNGVDVRFVEGGEVGFRGVAGIGAQLGWKTAILFSDAL